MEGSTNMKKAFTLVELLVVMAIIGVLAALAVGSFRTAQMRGRDAQRKSDLKQISNSLELFYADYGKYPSDVTGRIAGCPYNPALSTGTSCTWGISEFSDSKTVYFKILPIDPTSPTTEYIYGLVNSSNQKYRLFARLENPKDQNIDSSITVICGSGKLCNFAVTSANTSVSE
ncbi:MAG: pilin domain-containing protein, general secretion pathway protein G [Candidatus Woesebacteria bacterium GW2011_GWF1_31_35]|uniref:Type II secretion system pseudopilin OxpG n=1 Tax=Candidatus Woesebacteria bacterium GW2011_GWC2_31_9 TaxID=1618586 RepID=A0A0F9YIZ1_9BACT|nr:MAG: pilin domain-containing protein, general secretion pathway protein G [Candidatus Woesebacteria bacterium GW2011_GWF1_31_35]KKP22721.1 MAG: Type II secretion system pseudopilin OxpG [Candidatus Woesebacteria bacterium GW2011_GWC1_30_29]KKP25896.1 MAG: Type II secretion system pseudopilin OxpG [Candidatus Woesebacteria bacterium GW2011_GWD1_31_12]KKP27123.1 MAG: Type II secretion system pseudopilin OxpG [Candidatus Woesebacteria bacterium GW2011_GWB1_31_29]KKP31489.1 MAG: Type II secretio